MKVKVGSTNNAKVSAVKEILVSYKDFAQAEVLGVKTESGVSDQPKSLEETLTGAMNRAKSAFLDCDYSFGIESGLMAVPFTKTGYMDFTACAIYNGKIFHLGLSPAIECPEKLMHYVLNENLNFNQACFKAGLTEDREIGSKEGMLSLITHGRINRKEYVRQAVIMAMAKLFY
ncbi:MAG: inosine/xanthosine triphosphatase [bacterium]|nr:inosine/xanthosine triphosphatase [bacterium]